MKRIVFFSPVLLYITAFPITAHADKRIRIELPLPEHCRDINDVKQPSGVCVKGPLASYRLLGNGEVIWKDLGAVDDAADFFRMLDEMSGGSTPGN